MDNLQNAALVKFVSKFVNEQTLGKWLSKIMYMLNTNTFRQQAGKLFAWAIIIIVLATIIDKAFYWTRPEQKIIMTRYVANIQKMIEARSKNE